MAEQLEFYRDERGNACARGKDQRLATFLQTDLQGSPAVTQDLIDKLAGSDRRAEFSGNGHSVTITPVMAVIESHFDDEAPDRRMTRTHLLKQVTAWHRFISDS
jgi:hypothetical protein